MMMGLISVITVRDWWEDRVCPASYLMRWNWIVFPPWICCIETVATLP